ncbi:hypothetical protein GGR55DRAFT_475406 [Xylaria sp. FL0064]|nr:hypothetical protein GGR55DRAFT_475406 [Xylaria sp. FL0064]
MTFLNSCLTLNIACIPSICESSSSEFYEGNLLTGAGRAHSPLSPYMFPWPVDAIDKQDKARTIFIECAAGEDRLSQRSKSNEGQARLCHCVCSLLSTEGEPSQRKRDVTAKSEQSIVVLTSYTRRLEVLKKKLSDGEASNIDTGNS